LSYFFQKQNTFRCVFINCLPLWITWLAKTESIWLRSTSIRGQCKLIKFAALIDWPQTTPNTNIFSMLSFIFLQQLFVRSREQCDQIGRIFAHWATVFLKMKDVEPTFCYVFSAKKIFVLILTNKRVGQHFGRFFFTNSSCHPAPEIGL
jgi:hypothetical protein